jgi:preprotein translocase SecE subunit
VSYLKDSFEEIKKVTWPTNNQAVKVSIITIAFTVVSTLIITGFDFSFRQGYDALTDISPKAQFNRAAFEDLATDDAPPIELDSSMIQATDADGNPIEIEVTPTTP